MFCRIVRILTKLFVVFDVYCTEVTSRRLFFQVSFVGMFLLVLNSAQFGTRVTVRKHLLNMAPSILLLCQP